MVSGADGLQNFHSQRKLGSPALDLVWRVAGIHSEEPSGSLEDLEDAGLLPGGETVSALS